MIIGIIGGNKVSDQIAQTAYLVGKLIAERGGIVLCGGLGGVMESACKGAFEFGGMTIGILPGTDKADANPYVKIPIPTGLGYARNAIIAQTCDAYIAIGGAYGTLSEIAMALNNGKKVISLGSWDLEKAGPVDATFFIQATTPQDAVEIAMAVDY
jgi:uncharacterized protein (TIGR00725 family)